MDIQVQNLRDHMWKQRLSPKRLVIELNRLQKEIYPERRPITRNFIYHCLNGHTPTHDKMYLLAAVLKTHPKRLYALSIDEDLYNKNKSIYSKLDS